MIKETKLLKLRIQLFADGGEEDTTGSNPTVDTLLGEIEEIRKTSVSRTDYEKLVEDNNKLIKEIANNRHYVEPPKQKVDTKEDVMTRCAERTAQIGEGNSLQNVIRLTENYRDMEKIGLDVSNVDKDVVEFLEETIKKAEGSNDTFTALMSNIK